MLVSPRALGPVLCTLVCAWFRRGCAWRRGREAAEALLSGFWHGCSCSGHWPCRSPSVGPALCPSRPWVRYATCSLSCSSLGLLSSLSLGGDRASWGPPGWGAVPLLPLASEPLPAQMPAWLGACPPLSLWPHCSGVGMGRVLRWPAGY